MSDETPMALCIGGPEAGIEYPAQPPGVVMNVAIEDDNGGATGTSFTYRASLYTTEAGGIHVWIADGMTIHDVMLELLEAYTAQREEDRLQDDLERRRAERRRD